MRLTISNLRVPRRAGDRYALLVASLALVFRLVLVLAPGLPEPGTYEDVLIAHHVAAGRGFVMDPSWGPTAMKAPAYAALLAPLLWLDLERSSFLLLAGVLNALLGAFAVLAVYALASTLWGPARGLVAALAMALFPAHAWLARIPESSSLSIPLVVLTTLLIVRAGSRPSVRTWLIAGASSGVALLSNPVGLPALVTGCVLLARSARHAALALLACLLVLAPWTLRNYQAFGKLVPIKSPFWLNIYLGFQPQNIAGKHVVPADLMERIESATRGRPDFDREAEIRRLLLPWMQENPGSVLRTAAWRVGQYWGLWGQPPRLGPWLDSVLRRGVLHALLLLALAATPAAWQQARRPTLLLLAFLATYTLTYAFTCAPLVRYNLEVAWTLPILASRLPLRRVRPEGETPSA